MKENVSHMLKICLCLLLMNASFHAFSQSFNILDFGAKPDEKTINTQFIQEAIDKCSQSGGGRVVVPAGTFLSGTIRLRSRVNLHLLPGATLLGSTEFHDYPQLDIKYESQFNNTGHSAKNELKRYRAFLFAENAQNVSITGEGTIDGNGGARNFQLSNDASSKISAERPILIMMINCRDIYVAKISLRNSAYWMQNYLACENLHIKGISVYNHSNYNNDGIDIDSKNVLIEDCYIDSDDDGICLKSHDPGRYCENVIIRNCTVRSNCNGIKLGTGSSGGFRNIQVSNISIRKASVDLIRNWQKKLKFIEQPITVLAGIAIENVDGGITDNITVSNVFMTDVQTPIFIKLGNRNNADVKIQDGSQPFGFGSLRNIKLENITASGHSKMASSITGFPGHDVEGIQLSNIYISSMGNGTLADGQIKVPENEKYYPENRMFGQVIPASGLYIRHAKGISLQNVNLKVRNKDYRPAVIMDDVKQGYVSLVDIDTPAGNTAPVKLVNGQNLSFFNVNNNTIPYLEISGEQSEKIHFANGSLNKKNILIRPEVRRRRLK
jgi:polygalacturonase